MHKKFYIILIAGICCFLQLTAQDKSNRGKEFWLAYGFDYSFFHESPVNFQELALYISTEQAATVTVTITNTGYTQTLNIPANTVDATILIPKTGADDARTLTDGLQNRGIHIVSDVPVAVYAHVYSTQVSGATMLMPVETYGYLYHSINYSQATSASPLPVINPTTANGADWYSWFYIIASENNTRVEITPSDTTKNGWLPGQTYIVNLNKGESYHVFGKLIAGNNAAYAASKDMTGSKVLSVIGGDGSCHPVAVFSGSGGIRLCRGDGGEFVHQQVFPAQAWGTRYLTYHTINNTNTDILETNRNYYRICVADPLTVVRKNGVIITGLIKNFYYEYMDSTGGDYIEANNPILVAQYTPNKNQCWNFPSSTPAPPSYGDPEMFYLSPIEQGQKSVLFYTSRKQGIDYVYTNIHLLTAAVNSLKVDGNTLPASQIITHPNNPAFSVALARFIGPAAKHAITCDSAFNATVYGLGNYESYGYNVGTLINNLNVYGGVINTFSTNTTLDTVTCRNTPVRLYVKLAHQATIIHWKLSQVVPGITPNTDSIINNPVPVATEIINGRTYYVYTLQQDFIFTSINPNTIIPITYSSLVIPNCFQTENATVKVNVKDGPKSDFSFTSPNCLSDSVSLTGTFTANGFNITQYLWNFTDNTTANTITTNKKFTAPGIHNVRFRAIADNGCAGDTVKPITITPLPIAKMGMPASACTNENVAVTDTSVANSGTLVNWRYDFGDGTVVANNNGNPFFHQYKNPGTYTAKLVVSTAACKSDTSYKTIYISPGPNTKFSFDKNICLGDSIKFSDSSSITVGSIISLRWAFGDGNTATYFNNIPFFYKYTAVGVYTVILQTTSSNGCTDTFSLRVSVNNKPTANITVTGKPCVDSSFVFTSSLAYNANNPAIWYWDFGNGQNTAITNSNIATRAYSTAANNITVKHTAGYGPGCFSDTAYFTIPLINTSPTAVPFNLSAISACAMEPVLFTANIPSGITNLLWDFGDGTGNQFPPFSRSFATANNYNVSLQVFNTAGCGSAISANSVIILPSPKIFAGTDKFISTGGSTTLDAAITNAANYNYLWVPSAGLNSATVLNPVAAPAATITYAVIAADKLNNCTSTDSVKVTVISKLFIPNAFTPNSDGLHDKWNIPGMALYPDGVVIIFNRYGEKIFETKNYITHPWDGTYKSKQQPSGSFIYLIKLNDNKNQTLQGTVTVIR
jgi:gliding motility-associated-like protein